MAFYLEISASWVDSGPLGDTRGLWRQQVCLVIPVWRPLVHTWVPCCPVPCPVRNAFTPQPACHIHCRQPLYWGADVGRERREKERKTGQFYTQHGPPLKALEDGPICGFRIILEVQETVWRNTLIHYCQLKPDLIFLGFTTCPLSVSEFHLGPHVMIIWNVSLGISWLCQFLRYFLFLRTWWAWGTPVRYFVGCSSTGIGWFFCVCVQDSGDGYWGGHRSKASFSAGHSIEGTHHRKDRALLILTLTPWLRLCLSGFSTRESLFPSLQCILFGRKELWGVHTWGEDSVSTSLTVSIYLKYSELFCTGNVYILSYLYQRLWMDDNLGYNPVRLHFSNCPAYSHWKFFPFCVPLTHLHSSIILLLFFFFWTFFFSWLQSAPGPSNRFFFLPHLQVWLNGHEFEQTPGDSEGQGSLVCCWPESQRVGHDWATEQQQHLQVSHFSKEPRILLLENKTRNWELGCRFVCAHC